MPLKYSFAVIILMCMASNSYAQDAKEPPLPLMVSHLPASNRFILKTKHAGKHHFFKKVLCFSENCRRAVGWKKSQRQKRYDGFKDVPQVKEAKKTRKHANDTLVHTTPPVMISPDTTSIKEFVAPLVKTPPKERSYVLSDVLFDVNSPMLKEGFTYQLDTLVAVLNRSPNMTVTIIGHTDNTGREAYNQRLSTSRAESVGLYLIDNGIDQMRIRFEGRGSSEPIADNMLEEGRRKNRRVEIILKE